jgi:ATP-dependent Clp protease ATP-binding subunit ClpX
MTAGVGRRPTTTSISEGTMSTTPHADPTAYCSFCTKAESEVEKLISGPGVHICETCVRLCDDILTQAAVPSGPFELPGWSAGMTVDEMLEQLPRIASMGAQVDAGMQLRVDLLRARGVTWARIGEALGMTRQSAWEKFAADE